MKRLQQMLATVLVFSSSLAWAHPHESILHETIHHLHFLVSKENILFLLVAVMCLFAYSMRKG